MYSCTCTSFSWDNLIRIIHFVVTHFPGNGNDGKQPVLVDAMRFRPNIVISGPTPYDEDNWKKLHIGEAYFTVSIFCPPDPIVRREYFGLFATAELLFSSFWMVHVQSMGGCNRCQMINLYQNSGQVLKSKEPLATLASYRRKKVSSCANCLHVSGPLLIFPQCILNVFTCEQGKILFGVLLNYEDGIDGENEIVAERWLQVGQQVYPSTK